MPPMTGAQASVTVVGSGVAGLVTALELAGRVPVRVITGAGARDSNTAWAQGGIAAALGTQDSPAQHFADTIAAGAGLVDSDAARVLCDEGPHAIALLQRYGVAFDARNGGLALGQEAAHSHARIVHAGGDRTGAAVEDALLAEAKARGVEIVDLHRVTRLLVEGGVCRGVATIDAQAGAAHTFESDAVVLATGGAGQLFSLTTNPEVATGSGIALAFEAGAEVMDLEFFQFHPTALRLPGVRPFLISEAVRGEGAVLRNVAGERFMPRYDSAAELAPRDVVARAIVREMGGAGHVLLDCSPIPADRLAARFPGIFSFCLEAGLDIRQAAIPVAPAAHYYMGGVRTDTDGRTTLAGLWACGEVACTGVHGANRLASNSLLEGVVFGRRVAGALVDGETCAAAPSASAVAAELPAASLARPDLQRLMWERAGIDRDAEGMRTALTVLEASGQAGTATGLVAVEGRQMSMLAVLMLQAALVREESRGAHYRTDFPGRDDAHWLRRQVFRRG